MKKDEEFQSILSFIHWLSSSYSGVGLFHLRTRTPLSEKDKIEIAKQYSNSPERT